MQISKLRATQFGGACATITTVGYGERVSVTTEGRTLAMILMISGIGLFEF